VLPGLSGWAQVNGRDFLGLDEEKKAQYDGEYARNISFGFDVKCLALTVVNVLPLEDYVKGVVPYEMGDNWPMAAMEAQAVCARTYALNKLGANKDYDVVDTTNDQVFKGVNYNYTTALRAVKETAGVVGTYKGKLATCYYSASNGGQTELVQHVWSGRGDWDYYQMTDDPYDVENPESVVRRAKIAKNGDLLHLIFLFQLLFPSLDIGLHTVLTFKRNIPMLKIHKSSANRFFIFIRFQKIKTHIGSLIHISYGFCLLLKQNHCQILHCFSFAYT
jgi:hypothetical protein